MGTVMGNKCKLNQHNKSKLFLTIAYANSKIFEILARALRHALTQTEHKTTQLKSACEAGLLAGNIHKETVEKYNLILKDGSSNRQLIAVVILEVHKKPCALYSA